jgi:hypothetical protein
MSREAVAAWLEPWICLRAAIVRDRANAMGLRWFVTRKSREMRAALLVGLYVEEVNMRLYHNEWAKRKKPAGIDGSGEAAGENADGSPLQ